MENRSSQFPSSLDRDQFFHDLDEHLIHLIQEERRTKNVSDSTFRKIQHLAHDILQSNPQFQRIFEEIDVYLSQNDVNGEEVNEADNSSSSSSSQPFPLSSSFINKELEADELREDDVYHDAVSRGQAARRRVAFASSSHSENQRKYRNMFDSAASANVDSTPEEPSEPISPPSKSMQTNKDDDDDDDDDDESSPTSPQTASWLNMLALILISQYNGHQRTISVFHKPLMERYGWRHSQLSSIFSAACFAQAAGFFLGAKAISRVGVKNSGLLGGASLAVGSLLSSLFLLLFKKRGLIPLTLSYSLLTALGIGILETSAFLNISENYQSNARVAYAVYLALSSLAPAWMSPLYTSMLKKFGPAGAISLVSIGVCLTIPILSQLQVKELYGEKDAQQNAELRHSMLSFLKKALGDKGFFAYTFLFSVFFCGRTTIQALGSVLLQECSSISPLRASFVLSAAAILSSLSRFLLTFFETKQMTEQRSVYLGVLWQMAALAGMLLSSPSSASMAAAPSAALSRLFRCCFLLFCASVAFAIPAGSWALDQAIFNGTRDEKRVFARLQSMMTLLGGVYPVLASSLRDRFGSHRPSLAVLLGLNGTAMFLMHRFFVGKQGPSSTSSSAAAAPTLNDLVSLQSIRSVAKSISAFTNSITSNGNGPNNLSNLSLPKLADVIAKAQKGIAAVLEAKMSDSSSSHNSNGIKSRL